MPIILLLIVTALLGAVEIPAGLVGTYQVRWGGPPMKPVELRSPRQLIVVTTTTASLQWDDVSASGTIMDCLVGEGAHSAPIVALIVKGETSTYRINFTFSGSEYTSEVKIMAEDTTKRRLLGNWREGRRR